MYLVPLERIDLHTYTLILARLAKFPREEWPFTPVIAKVHLELRRCTEATSVGHADVRRLVADPLHARQVPSEAPRLRAVMPINRHGAPVVDEVRGNVVIGKIFSVPRQRRAFRHEASGDARVRPVFQRAADQLLSHVEEFYLVYGIWLRIPQPRVTINGSPVQPTAEKFEQDLTTS